MEYSLVGEGLKFMVLGMLIVFAFLLVLVQVMKLQAKLVTKYFPDKAPDTPVNLNANNATQNEQHVAAIIAAITDFRKNKS